MHAFWEKKYIFDKRTAVLNQKKKSDSILAVNVKLYKDFTDMHYFFFQFLFSFGGGGAWGVCWGGVVGDGHRLGPTYLRQNLLVGYIKCPTSK